MTEYVGAIIQGGALVLLALVLWFAGRAMEKFLAAWLRAYQAAAEKHGAAIEAVRESIEAHTATVASLRLESIERHGALREHLSAEAKATRHDVRAAIATTLSELAERGNGRSQR